MSGGSYSYLCDKSADDIIGDSYYSLLSMSEDLHTYFTNSRADKDTDELVRLIGHLKVEIKRRAKALQDVWHAQEWWLSSDYGRDDVQKQIDLYEAGCK